jgi:Mn2+/Fe2+ NRAMP family transporter
VGEALKWRIGLEARPQRAKKFYWLLAAIVVAGLSLNLIRLDPIKALFWSAVINGVVCPPIMVSMMLIASNREAMKQFTISPRLKAMGWFATAVMTLISVGSILTALFGR